MTDTVEQQAPAQAAQIEAARPEGALSEVAQTEGGRSEINGEPAEGHRRTASKGPLLGRIDRLSDVAMVVTVELGRAEMPVRDLLGLRVGSIVELNRPVGSPADVLVNGKLIARGEIVVIDEEFGVRITELVGGDEPAEEA